MANKHRQGGISIGRASADVVRKTTNWYFVLAPFTLFYFGIALNIGWHFRPV